MFATMNGLFLFLNFNFSSRSPLNFIVLRVFVSFKMFLKTSQVKCFNSRQ